MSCKLHTKQGDVLTFAAAWQVKTNQNQAM